MFVLLKTIFQKYNLESQASYFSSAASTLLIWELSQLPIQFQQSRFHAALEQHRVSILQSLYAFWLEQPSCFVWAVLSFQFYNFHGSYSINANSSLNKIPNIQKFRNLFRFNARSTKLVLMSPIVSSFPTQIGWMGLGHLQR